MVITLLFTLAIFYFIINKMTLKYKTKWQFIGVGVLISIHLVLFYTIIKLW
jgi:hypothetical protein